MTQEVFDRAGRAIGTGLKPAKKVYDTSLLSGVAYCDECERPMHSYRQITNGKLYEYYRCSGNTGSDGRSTCRAKSVSMPVTNDAVQALVLDVLGDVERFEKVRVSGANDERVADLSTLIADLSKRSAESDDDELDDQIRDLKRERKTLRESSGPDRIEYRSLGETYRQAWDHSDVDGRRLLLSSQDIVFRVRRGDSRAPIVAGYLGVPVTTADGQTLDYVPLSEFPKLG